MTSWTLKDRWLAASALVCAALLGTGAAARAAASDFTEFPLPNANSHPNILIVGPDGKLWFTESDGNRIGRITTAGAITEFTVPTANSQPVGIVVGPDNNLWFTESGGDQIGRITTAGAFTEFLIPTVGAVATGIAKAGGKLWYAGAQYNDIGNVTTTGVIQEIHMPGLGKVFAPSMITKGPDNNLWFTETLGSAIGRMTQAGVATQFPLPTAGAKPWGIVSGPDGALWFTEGNGNKIGKITTAGVITEYPIQTSGSGPSEITVGPDGALWFTEAAANKLGRITTAGAITEFDIPTSGSQPEGIVTGPDGNLWFTENSGNKIARFVIPPASGCVANATTLCISDHAGDARFEVRLHFQTSQGGGLSGDAKAITLSGLGITRGGLFYFTDATNPEILIKVLNACGLNQKFWVFYAAGTNLGFTVTVRDTQTGATQTYTNADLHNADPKQDTAAFACAAADSASEEAVLAEVEAVSREMDAFHRAADRGGASAPALARVAVVEAERSAGTDSPQGSTYEFELRVGQHTGGSSSLYKMGSGTGDNVVTFDGVAETIDPYCCNEATTPTVNESYVSNGNGTATITITATAPNGKDLFPGDLEDSTTHVALTDGGVLIGAFTGDPLDWSAAHTVTSATVDLLVGTSSVFGGPSSLAPATFFGAPGTWDGRLAVAFPNQSGKGITKAVVKITVTTEQSSSLCVADAHTLCIADRFRARLSYATTQGGGISGEATAIPLTSLGVTRGGLFYFTDATNPEMLFKILDGCVINQSLWAFFSATTNLGFTLTVDDLTTGLTKIYSNEDLKPAAPVNDTAALKCPTL